MPTTTARATDARMNAFWTWRPSSPTPSLEEAVAAGAIKAGTSEEKWHSLTPGMRREIVRDARRRYAALVLQKADEMAADDKRDERQSVVERKNAAHFAAKSRF